MGDNMQGLRRTDYCAALGMTDVGREVVVCGWVQRQRDLGQLIFIDLRDRTGIVQLAFYEGRGNDEAFKKAFCARAEYVVCAKGVVKERTAKNPQIKTGDVEIEVEELQVLAVAQTPPFEIVPQSNVNEELRLKYRYLDLRRADLQDKIMQRHRVVKLARDYFDENGFVEIETPYLIKSTPEGARDYLVPSRVFPGNFFALPQSPQLYKQLTMLAGFDKYFQVARCFRDEDLRAQRQPEFTQLDMEMSFVNSDDVMAVAEGLLKRLFKEVLGREIETPFARMRYDEAMERYGSDKPDVRFGLELVNLTDALKGTEFRVFFNAIEAGGAVRAINAKGGAEKFARKELDKLAEWVKDYGAKGLAWTKLNGDGSCSSSYEKNLKPEEAEAVRVETGAEPGDVIFVVADENDQTVQESLGALRCRLAKELGLVDNNEFKFLWVYDFPLFEYDEDEKRLVAKHHPFTSPRDEDLPLLETNPMAVRAKAYDIVLNGNEIGGGSIRINTPEMQERMLNLLGFSKEQADERFGFLIDAFKYGAPPHGGLAFGLDRLVMAMLGCDSIRDVIAFPKVATSAELMSAAPGAVDKKQLEELGIEPAATKK